MPSTYKVYHRDIHGESTADSTAGFIAPINWQMDENLGEISTIAYDVSLHDKRRIKHDWVEPLAHDFVFVVNDGQTYHNSILMQGVVTGHNIKAEGEVSSIRGEDYFHLFQRRIFPFDPSAPYPYPYTVDWSDKNIATILTDIWNTLFVPGMGSTLSGYIPFINSMAPLSFAGDDTLFKQNYRIEYGSTDTFYDIFTTFAEQYPGFDYRWQYAENTFIDTADIVSNQPALFLYAYEYDTTHTSVYDLQENSRGVIPGIIDIEWDNSGPGATHAAGQGAGTSSSLWQNYNYQPSADVYRRLDIAPNFGTLLDPKVNSRATAGALGVALAPIYELTLTINPDFVKSPNGFWMDFKPGSYFFIKKDLKAHALDGLYKIVQRSSVGDTEGQVTVTLSCNRETNLSLNFSDDTP